ncbi:MAG: histidinol-phosphatase, partial [Chthoniobacteraceae bacterium]
MRILPSLLLALTLHFSATAAEPARWWKGNLHTHSLWSDGDDDPEMIADWYKAHGYNFLALSDHNIIADYERWVAIAKTKGGQGAFDKYAARFGTPWVETRPAEMGAQVRLKMLSEFAPKFDEPGRFLMVKSEEITDRYLTAPIHINATNVREVIKPQGGKNIVDVMQRNLAEVFAQRARTGVPMFAHINHPNFGWALTAEELNEVEQEQFFEVYNGHPTVHNEGGVAGTSNGGGSSAVRASTGRIWDIVLTKRVTAGKRVLYGMATD